MQRFPERFLLSLLLDSESGHMHLPFLSLASFPRETMCINSWTVPPLLGCRNATQRRWHAGSSGFTGLSAGLKIEQSKAPAAAL